MTYKKYHLFFFCAVLILSAFLFLRDAYCLDEAADVGVDRGPSLLQRKIGSTFRSQSKSEFLIQLTEARANLKKRMSTKSEGISALWSTAFENPEHFDEILNHLIAVNLQSPECNLRKVIKRKSNVSFKFLYKKKEDEDLKERLLTRIVFLNQASIPDKFRGKEKKSSSKREVFSFFSFLGKTQNNPTDDLVLKMLWNVLDAVFINTLSNLSSYSSTKKVGVHKVLILNGDMENRKGIMVDYYTNVLDPKSSGAKVLEEEGLDEAGEGDSQGHDLPMDTEYMENGDSSGEEADRAGSSKSEKKELGLEDEYMWTGSNFE